MKVIGLDLSLTAIGVAGDFGTRVLTHKLPAHATEPEKCERLHTLSARVDVITRDADVVVIEGYSFGSQHSHAHSLGELGGLVKVILWRREVPFVIVTPSALKKYATDNGGASKDKVLAAGVRDGYPGDDNNSCDAWWLRRMGLAHYLNNDAVLPAYKRQVLERIIWPRLPVAV